MKDFVHHNVDVFAALLESCGRYLYMLPYTRSRLVQTLEAMLRLRRAKNLDLRQQTLLESAYFTVKPPEKAARSTKAMTAVQRFIKHLLLKRLGATDISVDDVIRTMRRLPWNSDAENVEFHVVRMCLKLCRTKYVLLPLVADCISGLSKHRMNCLISLVDQLLEEVQCALEQPHKRIPQRVLGVLRLLGELYNYTALSSSVVFHTLYLIINHGHEVLGSAADGSDGEEAAAVVVGYDPMVPSQYDPPHDVFRAQMVCELLNACGQYFVLGTLKDKLAVYLMYFQRYLLCKGAMVPRHIEFAVLDTLDALEEAARTAMLETQQAAKPAAHKKRGAHGKREESESLPKEFVYARYATLESVQSAVAAYEQTHPNASLVVDDGKEDGDDAALRSARGGEAGEDRSEDEVAGPEKHVAEDMEDNSSSEEEVEEEGETSSDEDEEEEDPVVEAAREEARAVERVRKAEEEDEFDRAFRSMMQVSGKDNAHRHRQRCEGGGCGV